MELAYFSKVFCPIKAQNFFFAFAYKDLVVFCRTVSDLFFIWVSQFKFQSFSTDELCNFSFSHRGKIRSH